MTEFYDINFQPVLQQDDTLGKQKILNKGETPLFSYKVDLNNSFSQIYHLVKPKLYHQKLGKLQNLLNKKQCH